jgi:hypothetical protein
LALSLIDFQNFVALPGAFFFSKLGGRTRRKRYGPWHFCGKAAFQRRANEENGRANTKKKVRWHFRVKAGKHEENGRANTKKKVRSEAFFWKGGANTKKMGRAQEKVALQDKGPSADVYNAATRALRDEGCHSGRPATDQKNPAKSLIPVGPSCLARLRTKKTSFHPMHW